MQQSNRNDWNIRFEVTFYGNDPNKESFREIQERLESICGRKERHRCHMIHAVSKKGEKQRF